MRYVPSIVISLLLFVVSLSALDVSYDNKYMGIFDANGYFALKPVDQANEQESVLRAPLFLYDVPHLRNGDKWVIEENALSQSTSIVKARYFDAKKEKWTDFHNLRLLCSTKLNEDRSAIVEVIRVLLDGSYLEVDTELLKPEELAVLVDGTYVRVDGKSLAVAKPTRRGRLCKTPLAQEALNIALAMDKKQRNELLWGSAMRAIMISIVLWVLRAFYRRNQ